MNAEDEIGHVLDVREEPNFCCPGCGSLENLVYVEHTYSVGFRVHSHVCMNELCEWVGVISAEILPYKDRASLSKETRAYVQSHPEGFKGTDDPDDAE